MTVRILFLLIIGVFALDCNAQSLPEVARQERERQKQVVSKYVFTNEDLTLARVPTVPLREESPGDADQETAAPTQGGRTEEQWRAEFNRLQADVPRSQERVALLELQLNELNRMLLNQSDMYNREGQLAPQIQSTQEELETARDNVTTAEKAVVDLREELRRSGAPAGWGRPQ